VKILDFGLAKIIDNASTVSDDVYEMSGETGSLRYMSPEVSCEITLPLTALESFFAHRRSFQVADSLPYNQKADVYSFGMILWELATFRKPFEGLTRDSFYERVVHGGERPPINKKWPEELKSLMTECWE
jgi:serine/threonine protein kinase